MIKEILLMLMVSMILLAPGASARKGVGIVWDTEMESVTEGTTHCVSYGVYNPWDEDVNAKLSVSSELKQIITNERSEVKFIEAGTMHDDAIPVELCFDIARAYEEDCTVPGLFCKQTCEEDQVTYSGKILVEEESSGSLGGSAGSSTSLGVSVPLKLVVKCRPHERDFTVLYAGLILVSAGGIYQFVIKPKRKKK